MAPRTSNTTRKQAQETPRQQTGPEQPPAAEKNAARTMSEEHRDALRSGREETRIVRAYLEALEQHRPRRGPKRDAEKLRARIERIDDELPGAGRLESLTLHQERLDLESEIADLERRGEIGELEEEFVKVAAAYSARRGISPQAWLAVGVSKQTLRKAGIGAS